MRSIISKEKVIQQFEDHLKIEFHQVHRKRILLQGKLKDCSTVVLFTPESKLYRYGYWRTDLTTAQVSVLENADLAILAFRLEGNRVYYVDFNILKPYLTKDAVIYQKYRDRTFWKLHIWPDHVLVLGNKNPLPYPTISTESGDY
jgi:hypothetical protein